MKGSDLISRNEALLTTEVDGELLAMSIEKGACYGLNAVGTTIWNLLATPRTVDALCVELVQQYDVVDAVCRAEVASFLDTMQREAMVAVMAGE